jgi:hypothetical protein
MNTIESNKLIAEFMGMKKHHNDNSMMVKTTSQGNEVVFIDTLQYNSSWDWLMPVVQKIREYKHYQSLDGIEYTLLCCLTIDNLYIEVVEFIKEYNKLNN